MNLPLEAQIWGAKECAEYFRETTEYFLRKRRHGADFPAPLKMSKGRRPTWSAAAVIKWALRS